MREFLEAVKNGSWRSDVELIREANRTSKEKANTLKVARLPSIKASGTFRGSTAEDLIKHSGLLPLDFDDVGKGLDTLEARLRDDPYVIAFFRSPRGNGLKVLVPVRATNPEEHKRCARSAFDHFGAMMTEGAELDTAPSNVSANCFASWDPNLWTAMIPRSIFEPAPDPQKEDERKTISEVSEASMASMSQGGGLRSVRARAEKRLEALSRKGNPERHLHIIFTKYLERRSVVRGTRFKFLQKAIPSLFSVLAPSVLRELLLLHYDLHAGIWTTSRTDHEREIQSMLSAYAVDHIRTLAPAAREQYQCLDGEASRAAFRIGRDLAKKDGTFFLGYACLGVRIGLHRQQAQRIMTGLYADGIIDLIEPGSIWADGQKPKATLWKWMLP